jgi:hypothetical protein
MRRFVVMAAIISLGGCTTPRPIEGTSNELQSRISYGGLLEAGDRILIVTTDNKTHKFRVREISAGFIVGRKDSVPVDQVVSLKRREFSLGKTLSLVGAAALLTGLIVYGVAEAGSAGALSATP